MAALKCSWRHWDYQRPRGLDDDQVDFEPPPHLSLGGLRSSGLLPPLPHRSVSEGGCLALPLLHLSESGGAGLPLPPPHLSVSGGACAEPSVPPRRNLGTYFPAAGAAAAPGSGPAGSSEDLEGPSTKRASLLIRSFSSSSRSLCLCFSAILSNFALCSASSFLRLSSSAF